MNSYRIERPVKWEGNIRKSGSIEASEKDAAPLVLSGALVLDQLMDATLAGVVDSDGTQVDLDEMKVEELKDLAKDLEIEGYSNMRKPALVDAIKAVKVQVEP